MYLIIPWKKDIPTDEIKGKGLKTRVVLVTNGAYVTFLFEKVRCVLIDLIFYVSAYSVSWIIELYYPNQMV